MRRILCLLSLVLIAAVSISRTQTSTTSCPATFQQVVATFERSAMTERVPNTTIFRPTKDGLFRITSYLEITQPTPGLTGQWFVVEGWETGLNGPSARGDGGASANFDHVQATFTETIAHDVAGSAIQVMVVPIDGDGSGTMYNVRVVVEQLM
jgi:hypothetical protein